MKLAGNRFSLLVTVATAIILLSPAGFAQTESGASGDRAAGDAHRIVDTKQQVINSQDPVQPVGTAIKPWAASTFSILPPDIFASATEPKGVETWYPVSVRGLTASKNAGQGKAGQGKDDELAALAKTLRNPVSSLPRLSSRNSFDIFLAGDREGWRYIVDFEPVIPIRLNKDWNLISRTTLPVVQQDGLMLSTVQTGLGDITQSVFLSPRKTEPFFWGAGTALQVPTATDTHLGTGKFGLGPALAIGKQQGAWTYGALAHHIWSVAGHSDRADVRSTYIQPFLAYTTKSAWTYSLDTEASYDWVGKQWSVPIHVEVAKVLRFGRQPVSVGAALRCWAATPPGGPQACGVRFIVTPLFTAR